MQGGLIFILNHLFINFCFLHSLALLNETNLFVIIIYMKKAPVLSKKERIWELDFIRGFCVLLMIFDHFMYDIAGIFGEEWYYYALEHDLSRTDFLYTLWQLSIQYYWHNPLRDIVEPTVVIIFCIVCGISCSFSRSNLKRGLIITALAFGIYLVTSFMGEDSTIRFGVFQMFAFAILFWCLINFCCKKNKTATAIACGIIGLIIVVLNYVFIDIYKNNVNAFSQNSDWFFIGEFMLGEPNNVPSADYQPIFPLVGYMLLGAFIGPFIYKKKKTLLPILGKYDWYEPVNLWGRIAMWVYVAHQVVIAGLLAIISAFFLTPGNFILI